MSRKTGISVLICFVFVLSLTAGRADPAKEQPQCQCPCPCPKEEPAEPAPDSKECPETIVLKQLVEVYEEVVFPHAEHADLADEGCGTCHHHTPPGVYKKCGTCHNKGLFEKEKLNMLNLRAAYHRECIGCHEEWESGPTGCTECHEIRE